MDQKLNEIFMKHLSIQALYRDYAALDKDAKTSVENAVDKLVEDIRTLEMGMPYTIELYRFSRLGANLKVEMVRVIAPSDRPPGEVRRIQAVDIDCHHYNHYLPQYNWAAWGAVTSDELGKFCDMLEIANEFGPILRKQLISVFGEP